MVKCDVLERFSYKGRAYYPSHYALLPEDKARQLAEQGKVKLPDDMQVVGPSENKVDGPELHKCDNCDREFDSPQGKAAHERFCE